MTENQDPTKVRVFATRDEAVVERDRIQKSGVENGYSAGATWIGDDVDSIDGWIVEECLYGPLRGLRPATLRVNGTYY